MAFPAVVDQLTLAREYALLGEYDTSVVYFDGVVSQINKHLRTLDDPYIKGKWMKMKKELAEEVELVKSLIQERLALRDGSDLAGPSLPKRDQVPPSPLDRAPERGADISSERGAERHANAERPLPSSAKRGGPFIPMDEEPAPAQAQFARDQSPDEDPDVWRPPSRDGARNNPYPARPAAVPRRQVASTDEARGRASACFINNGVEDADVGGWVTEVLVDSLPSLAGAGCRRGHVAVLSQSR
eukprot:gene4506-5522_t